MNETQHTPISIMIVDDHQIVIDGIKSLLSKEPKIAIVAEALNGKKAYQIIQNREIDLLIVDINMPKMSGTELTRKVKQNFPNIKVLVLSMYDDREIIKDIIMAEAEGYILKNTGKQELLSAINRIYDNGTYYCDEVVEIMRENIITEKKREENPKDLTPRELEILGLICQEYSSSEIAGKLFISQHTVDTHRKNILYKTKVKTIVGLIKFAIKYKIVE